jgi:hypothetical protein
MRKKRNEKPVRSHSRAVSVRPFEEPKVERAQSLESVDQIELSIEDDLDEDFPPEYGGSE